jgi:acyl carrier protein
VNNNINSILEKIFQDIFNNNSLLISKNTSAKDIDGWDSLTHIRLIVSIEKKFNIKFSALEIYDLKNVGEMQELIKKKLNG